MKFLCTGVLLVMLLVSLEAISAQGIVGAYWCMYGSIWAFNEKLVSSISECCKIPNAIGYWEAGNPTSFRQW